MEVKGLNNKDLSKKANLGYFEIAIIRNHPKKLNIITLRKLADALDVPPKLLAKYIIWKGGIKMIIYLYVGKAKNWQKTEPASEPVNNEQVHSTNDNK